MTEEGHIPMMPAVVQYLNELKDPIISYMLLIILHNLK